MYTHLSLVGLLFATISTAAAQDDVFDSEVVELEFTNRTDVFQALEYDSGIIPAGSPVGVRVYTRTRGGATTNIIADSELWWPPALTHGFVGYDEGGYFGLDTELSLNVSAVLDLSDIDLGTLEYGIWNESESFLSEAVFDGLLLPDDGPDEVVLTSRGRELGPVATQVQVFTGVSLGFSAEAAPVAEAELIAEGLATDDAWLTSVHDTALVEVPSFSQTRHITTWTGELLASLDLVVTPSAELCIAVVGCFQLASFDIDLPLGSYTSALEMTENYRHPLPEMEELPQEHDFGEVYYGTQVSLNLPVENLGRLPVEATFEIRGSDSFTVFPENAYALPEDADGVVVTFAPEAIGETTATLVVRSNDPRLVDVRIPLTGEGIPFPTAGEEPDPGNNNNGGGGGGEASVSSCGCATGSPAGGLSALPLLGLLFLRRRSGRQR